MKDIPHHVQAAAVLDLLTAQPLTRPDYHIVGQRAKQHQHVLRLKALLIALGEAQPLLIAFQGAFDAPTAQIVEGHICLQDGDGISGLRPGVPQHHQHLLGHLTERWRKHALDKDKITPNYYEAATFEALKGRVRSGDVAVWLEQRRSTACPRTSALLWTVGRIARSGI
jgi:hypothetical protein